MISSKFKQNILVISTARSDFGLMKNIIYGLQKIKKFNTKLLVTGNHLLKSYGNTQKEIKKIFKKNVIFIKTINIIKKNNKFKFNFNSQKLLNILKKEKPDLCLLMGDRYEVMLLSSFLSINQVPIGHISGGDITFGSTDDNYRHAITKLSSLHFAESHSSARIIQQLGENKKNIFNIGSISLEAIRKNNYINKNQIKKKYGLDFKKKTILFTLHPLSNTYLNEHFSQKIFKLILYFTKKYNVNFIITYPNTDPGNDLIIKEIKKIRNNKNVFVIKSFGISDYLSILKYSEFIMGNSSSCVYDSFFLNKKSLIIGDRQKGRELASSNIIQTNYSTENIKRSFKVVLEKKTVIKKFKVNNYPSNKIIKILKKTKFPISMLKNFTIQ